MNKLLYSEGNILLWREQKDTDANATLLHSKQEGVAGIRTWTNLWDNDLKYKDEMLQPDTRRLPHLSLPWYKHSYKESFC